ncbi:VOC family protein [Actinophytocola sp.]|uniref:VOC family protein n=1 Tax=Actinophytocola sp. TaxID=1872138 RepID=UPI002D7E7864|nr:VOC family protein [Actinophytocola sp.]HET9141287.1 VOC family protein [Actinophytocola sp.]
MTSTNNVRLGQPTLYATDVEATAAFYRRVGFEEAYRFPPTGDTPPAFICLNRGTFYLTISQIDVIRQQTGLPKVGRTTNRAFDITVIVTDVDGVVADLARAGARVLVEPRDQPWGDRHAYVTDPDGNYVQITTHADHDISQFSEYQPEWDTPAAS